MVLLFLENGKKERNCSSCSNVGLDLLATSFSAFLKTFLLAVNNNLSIITEKCIDLSIT